MTAYQILLQCLLLAVSAGIAATTYVNILTAPGQVLDFWARFLYRLQETFVGAVRDDPERVQRRHRFSDTLLKPLLTCVYCVGGQLGFWLSIYVQNSYGTRINLALCLLTAVLSVYMGGLFQYIQKKLFPLDD
ncbi:hypothetical protein GGR92_005217 [Spirosoma lacussanchae]|uniref:hypothetical protein n=1 Tax=Spirosoma lacussanchae TaxID=1884249 RepID=UPI00110916C1|nr:hypothetical protein [Spirosoma lacussanchae]